MSRTFADLETSYHHPHGEGSHQTQTCTPLLTEYRGQCRRRGGEGGYPCPAREVALEKFRKAGTKIVARNAMNILKHNVSMLFQQYEIKIL